MKNSLLNTWLFWALGGVACSLLGLLSWETALSSVVFGGGALLFHWITTRFFPTERTTA